MTAVYTVAEVAAMLRCSRHTIHRAVKAGELDHVRVLGVVRIPATALPASLTLAHDSSIATSPDLRGSAPADGSGEIGLDGPRDTGTRRDAGSNVGSSASGRPSSPPTDTDGGSN